MFLVQIKNITTIIKPQRTEKKLLLAQPRKNKMKKIQLIKNDISKQETKLSLYM